MSTFKSGLCKGVLVAVVVPVLMMLAMPVRALMLDGSPEAPEAVSVDTAVVKGSVTAFNSLPLPAVTVKSIDEEGTVLAMATTNPDGEFVMKLPASAGRIVVVPEDGLPTETTVRAGGSVEVRSTVPVDKVIGETTPGWWSELSATSKVAVIGLPAVSAAGAGYAITDDDDGSTHYASPVVP